MHGYGEISDHPGTAIDAPDGAIDGRRAVVPTQ
jgi:hypothetical protein